MKFGSCLHFSWVLPLLFVGNVRGEPGSAAKRPPVDRAAISEAISASILDDESYASSASYAHFLSARMSSELGDHRAAIQELQLALATDDGNPFLTTSLAEEYFVVSEAKRAQDELQRLLRRDPSYQPAHLLLGRILLEERKLTDAASHLRQAIKLKPEDSEAYLLLAQLHLEAGTPDQAMKVVEEMAAATPEPALGYKRLGLAFAERGDLARAEKLLKQSLETEPDDFEAWSTLGQIYDNTQRSSEAVHAYEKALEQDPSNPEVLHAIGTASLRAGAKNDAHAYFERLLQISETPEHVARIAAAYISNQMPAEAAQVLDSAKSTWGQDSRLAFYAGLVHQKLRHYRTAAGAFEQVSRESQFFKDARLHRAAALSLAGEHAAALQIFRQALEDKPDYLALYPAYSRALERMGNRQGAEKVLADAIRERPAPELVEALAAFYERTGKVGEAVSLLADQLAKHPGDETLLYALGTAYERKGDFERSIAQMRQILKANPTHAAAMNFIGYSLVERGKDLDEAERLIRRALEIRPDSAAFMDSLGWLYYRRGEFRRAVGTLERAAALEPDEPMIIEHLGDAYRSATNKGQAAAAYRRALDTLKADPELQEVEGQSQGLERKLKMLSLETADR